MCSHSSLSRGGRGLELEQQQQKFLFPFQSVFKHVLHLSLSLSWTGKKLSGERKISVKGLTAAGAVTAHNDLAQQSPKAHAPAATSGTSGTSGAAERGSFEESEAAHMSSSVDVTSVRELEERTRQLEVQMEAQV